MSDALILAVVGMVCVSTVGPITLALYLGRRFTGRASKDAFEVSLSPGSDPRQAAE